MEVMKEAESLNRAQFVLVQQALPYWIKLK